MFLQNHTYSQKAIQFPSFSKPPVIHVFVLWDDNNMIHEFPFPWQISFTNFWFHCRIVLCYPRSYVFFFLFATYFVIYNEVEILQLRISDSVQMYQTGTLKILTTSTCMYISYKVRDFIYKYVNRDYVCDCLCENLSFKLGSIIRHL